MFAAPLVDIAPPPESLAGFSIAHIAADAPFRIHRSCRRGDPDEIIVCGRRDDSRHRLGPLPPLELARPDPGLPLGIDLAPNLRLGPIVTQVIRPDGLVDWRVMLALRWRF